MKNIVLLAALLSLSISLSAQNGFLRGKVFDDEFGDALIGATVVEESDPSKGSITDFDGNYSLSLPAGKYTVVFSFVSFATLKISDIEIKSGEVTQLDVRLKSDMQELEAVVVTAEVAKSTDAAMLTVQKKSANLVDGVSSQTFRKVGDSDLGAAMKRVTGVTVQGGKYVYVRGLGDRYTKTTLNEMAIPGLDPDRNAVQMDIFPTNTIENVIVYKTFSPDLLGDFTGGIVDVSTKSFPEEKSTTISVKFGYNPNMHFNENFLSYEGGKFDWLGFDDGTRKLPFDKKVDVPNILASNGAIVEDYTRSFEPTLAGDRSQNFMNYSLSFNHGNQVEKGNKTFGYNAIFNYSRNDSYNEGIRIGVYTKYVEPEKNDLFTEEVSRYDIGIKDVMWNALFTGSMKYNKSSISMSLMRTQNGVTTASKGTRTNLDDNPSNLSTDNLLYRQSSVTSGILVGKHAINRLKVEWRSAVSGARTYEPDFRSSRIEIITDSEGNQTYGLNTGVGAGVDRFYRDLIEYNESAKADFTFDLGNNNKLKWGGLASFKQRDFEVIEYLFRVRGDMEITGNANDLLLPENIWTEESDRGTYVRGDGIIPSKTFNASQNLFGVYAMAEYGLTQSLRAIGGIRVESVDMYFTGEDQRGNEYDKQLTLDEIDFLPSINLVYAVSDDMNVRLSANRTLARPTFKEKSNAQIYDPITDRTFIGNLDLEETHINNYDVRWEFFYGAGEMVSLSGFYKQFDGHIEMTSFDTAPDQVKPRNSGESQVFGAEFEIRKSIIPDRLMFRGNTSFVKSMIDMKSVIVNESGKTEYELRRENLREGESLSSTRDMSGQSPIVVNAALNYNSVDKIWNANVSYNVQSETLKIVGSGRFPDIYTKPFHSLNLNIFRDFGANRVTFGVTNILNSTNHDVYKSYKASEEPTYLKFSPGRTFTVKYQVNF